MPRDALVMIRATSYDDLIAFFAAHFGAKQAEVSDVVLRTGVWAARDVEVDRLVDLEASIKKVRQYDGVRLGVSGSEAATFVPGAGDRTAQHPSRGEVQLCCNQCCFSIFNVTSRNVWDHEILPR